MEAKVTKTAVGVAVIWSYRLLLLWRSKWEDEGTPLLLPGGEVEESESLFDAARRELKEEIGLTEFIPDYVFFRTSINKPTKWAKVSYSVLELTFPKRPQIELDTTKFCGYLWVPLNNQPLISSLKPLMMPGLRAYIEGGIA